MKMIIVLAVLAVIGIVIYSTYKGWKQVDK